MIKKQEQFQQQLFPIDRKVLDVDFETLGHYDADSVQALKTIWLDDSLHGNPSYELLMLAARPEIEHYDSLRRPYEAGVLVGTIVMRHRLAALGKSYDTVNLSPAEQLALPPPNSDIKLSRFALSQFFDSDVDILGRLQATVEADWLQNGNTFQPAHDDTEPKNDWLAVGMGDALAAYAVAYYAPRHISLKTKPLEPEPLLKFAS